VSSWSRHSPSCNDQVVNQTVDERAEVYTVEPKVWEAAGMELMGGCLCIGCLGKADRSNADGKGLRARSSVQLIAGHETVAGAA